MSKKQKARLRQGYVGQAKSNKYFSLNCLLFSADCLLLRPEAA